MPAVDDPAYGTVVWVDADAMRSRLSDEADRLLAALDEIHDIEEVWVIGSATGEHRRVHANSDIDLVVVQRTELDGVERALALRHALAPREALDLFVYPAGVRQRWAVREPRPATRPAPAVSRDPAAEGARWLA